MDQLDLSQLHMYIKRGILQTPMIDQYVVAISQLHLPNSVT